MIKRLVGIAGLTFALVAAPGFVGVADAAPRTTVAKVKIVDFAFQPSTTTIAAGTVVKWLNSGAVNHTTTADGGKWDSGVLAPGSSFRFKFRKAGTFGYHCAIHPTMTATIVVT